MSETELLTKIILNLGETTPEILVLFMLIRWVWPDLKGLALSYLEVRERSQGPDPTVASIQALTGRVDAVMQSITAINAMLQAFVEDTRRTNGELGRLVGVAVGLVGDMAKQARSDGSATTPVSPNAGTAESGRAGSAARSVQT